ncbi:AAA family ATPase [Micromonospora sp. RV43]|uniref:AAA family ATPase n=1 Tax=Micromonospora sp. RV43 TaxID=1661387 RepID=UPI000AD5593A|nr:AAA family ATPase [Micromonospora sp. RV43]
MTRHDANPAGDGPQLVVLIGAAGAGKSTWAAARYRPSQVVSLDALRAVVADDECDQDATADAVALLMTIVNARLSRRLTTVVDATRPSRSFQPKNNAKGTRRGLRQLRDLDSPSGIAILAGNFVAAPHLLTRREAAVLGRPGDDRGVVGPDGELGVVEREGSPPLFGVPAAHHAGVLGALAAHEHHRTEAARAWRPTNPYPTCWALRLSAQVCSTAPTGQIAGF